jgi:hypothetical protein
VTDTIHDYIQILQRQDENVSAGFCKTFFFILFILALDFHFQDPSYHSSARNNVHHCISRDCERE